MSNVRIVSSLEEAKKLVPNAGEFVVIEGFAPIPTSEWKPCEGSSLPECLQEYKGRIFPTMIVKITEKKVKFFSFPNNLSLCCTVKYQKALKKLA